MIDQLLLDAIHWVVRAIEVAGIIVIVAGVLIALVRYAWNGFSPSPETVKTVRSELGRSILLGLEFLVAADIINTVAIEPTVESLIVLAGIVLIRTFLSFSLEVELQGAWPWRKRALDREEGDG